MTLKSQISSGRFRFLRAAPHVARSKPTQKGRRPSNQSPFLLPPPSSNSPLAFFLPSIPYFKADSSTRKSLVKTERLKTSQVSVLRDPLNRAERVLQHLKIAWVIVLASALVSLAQNTTISYVSSSSALTIQFSATSNNPALLSPLDRQSQLSKVSQSGLHSGSMYDIARRPVASAAPLMISGVPRATPYVALSLSPRRRLRRIGSIIRTIFVGLCEQTSASRTRSCPSANFSIEITGSGHETEWIELHILHRLDCVVARM
ncbi:hypothetical protein B0H14DRAFT_3126226 [Mycena olivaceomarginata]|nr:hypothetical protein B0H14DRAFT_3126226 [Mycena olivaceomarginata]